MKRFLSLFLTICLLIGLAPAVLAEEGAIEQAVKLFEAGEIDSIAMSGDTLYLAGSGKLYAYEDGAIKEKGAMPAQGQYVLFDSEEGVWALECEKGLVGTIEDGAFVEKLALDYAPMQGSDGVMMIYSLCRVGNTLYALAMDAATYTGGQEQLMRFNLTTGETQRDTLVYALSLAAYDDAAMVLRQDLNRIQNGETGMALDVLNEEGALGDTIVSNTDYQSGAMAQALDGSVYMSGGGQLKRLDGDKLTNICGIGVGTCISSYARITGDTYVVLCMEGVFAAPLAGSCAGTTLTIVGGTMDDAAVRFMQEHPDISLNFDSRQITGSESVRNDMEAGTGVDIYVVHELLGLRTLIDKGYVAEISSEALKADVARMYPQIREAIERDGKLYAYPQLFRLNSWGINRTAWNEIYGEDEPVPTTFDAFFDLLEEWQDEYADVYPEYQFTQIYYGMQQLLSTVLEQYALMRATGDESLVFDSPEFVAALERLSGMDLDTIDLENLTEETMAELMAVLSKPTIIDVMGLTAILSSYSDTQENDRSEPLAPMVFIEGETPAIRADLMAYVVNPASENVDAAMAYLEYMAENQSGDMKIMLHEDENEPVRPDYYEDEVKEANEELEEMRGRLAEETEEADKADIQAEIERVEKQLQDMEENEWLASAQGIAAYRELAPMMTLGSAVSFLYGGNDNMSATEEISNLLQRFIDGQMSARQMVKELDKKVQMIYLEGN